MKTKVFGQIQAARARGCAALVMCCLAGLLPAAADQFVPVRVFVPIEMSAGLPSTTPARHGKYVTISSIDALNPSRYEVQRFTAHDFHLLTDDNVYYPVARPGLESVDFTSTSLAGPRERLNLTVTFLVPNSVDTANFEFMPNWHDDEGASINFCCLYQ